MGVVEEIFFIITTVLSFHTKLLFDALLLLTQTWCVSDQDLECKTVAKESVQSIIVSDLAKGVSA